MLINRVPPLVADIITGSGIGGSGGIGRVHGFARMRFGVYLRGSDGKFGQTLEYLAARYQVSRLT